MWAGGERPGSPGPVIFGHMGGRWKPFCSSVPLWGGWGVPRAAGQGRGLLGSRADPPGEGGEVWAWLRLLLPLQEPRGEATERSPNPQSPSSSRFPGKSYFEPNMFISHDLNRKLNDSESGVGPRNSFPDSRLSPLSGTSEKQGRSVCTFVDRPLGSVVQRDAP